MTASQNPTHSNFIPPAVRAQAERAEALMKAAKEASPEAPAEAPAETPQVETPAPAPEMTFEAKPPAAEPPAPVTDAGNDQSWEQKFKSEQGRTRALRDEVAKMRADMAALQAQLETYQRGAPEVNFSGERLVTPEEEKEYGAEFMDLVGRRAKEIAAPLMKELTDLKAQLNGSKAVEKVNSQKTYYETLDKQVSNWRQINQSPDFLSWLQEKDAYSGQIRQDLLQSAHNSMDAERVLRFFRGFLQEAAAVAPQSDAQPDATQGKVPLEQLAAPGRAKSATVPSTGTVDKPIISTSEITAFYTAVAAGKFRGNQPEKDRIERLIWDAQNEGRVVNK
jgi:hypothetical protein